MTESAIIERLDSLTAAVQLLAQVSGARLTRAELAARLATAGYNAELCGARRASEPTPGYAGDNNGE